MKILLPSILATALLSACSSVPNSPAAKPIPAKIEPSKPKGWASDSPRIGMTKSEVRAQFGEPTDVSTSPRRELWTYTFNKWSVMHNQLQKSDGMNFIPFYGLSNAIKNYKNSGTANKNLTNSGTIIFGPDGRVIDCQWNALIR